MDGEETLRSGLSRGAGRAAILCGGLNVHIGAAQVSLSLYDASIPMFIRTLKNLSSFLDKAEAHAAAGGTPLGNYLEARLTPDMHAFPRQI